MCLLIPHNRRWTGWIRKDDTFKHSGMLFQRIPIVRPRECTRTVVWKLMMPGTQQPSRRNSTPLDHMLNSLNPFGCNGIWDACLSLWMANTAHSRMLHHPWPNNKGHSIPASSGLEQCEGGCCSSSFFGCCSIVSSICCAGRQ